MNIYQRLNKVREAVAYLKKDKQVGDAGKWGYKAITHDAVTANVRPEFIKHGIILIPAVDQSQVVPTGTTTGKGVPHIRYEARFRIRFVNMDDPQDFTDIVLDAHAIDDADKAPGKAVSYATKYAMLKVLSIETGEEDESRNEDTAGEKALETAVKAIENAADEDLLKQHYAAAYRAFDGNKAALAKIVTAKDKRKGELKQPDGLKQKEPAQ